MNTKQAVKLALDCIEKEIHRITFDAELFVRFNASHGEKTWKKRERLIEAKKTLSNIQLGLFKPGDLE